MCASANEQPLVKWNITANQIQQTRPNSTTTTLWVSESNRQLETGHRKRNRVCFYSIAYHLAKEKKKLMRMNELITTSADNTRQISLSWHLEVIFYHFAPSMPLSPPPQPPIISQEKEDGTASIVAIVFLSSCIFRVKTAVCVHPPTPLLSNHKIPHWKKKSPKSLNGLQSKKKRKDELNSIWGGPKGVRVSDDKFFQFLPQK